MSQQRHVLLIINPISGTLNKEGLERFVRTRLHDLGWMVDVAYTKGKGDATCLAQGAVARGLDGVIAAGGDGTVNETASALRNTNMPLGIIPMGSGNGLARHLGIPLDPRQAIDVILKGNTSDCDFGTVNSHPFFCTFGVGFDAAVSEKFAAQHRRGRMTYIRSVLSEYIKYKPEVYTISANGKILTEEAFLIAVCNASQYGNNAYIAPSASITDGLLDITIVHAGSPLDMAFVGTDLFTGEINSNMMIHSFRAPAAVIYRSGEGPAHLDGEPITLDDVMSVKCHAGALRLFVPNHQTAFRPIITPMENMIHDINASLLRIFRKY